MKKVIMFLFMLMGTAVLMAQTGDEIPIPTSPGDVFVNLNFWIGAFLPLVGLTIMLTATVLKIFKIEAPGLKQVLSWGLGVVLVVILNLINLGIPKDLTWYGTIAYCIAVALGANRVFDVKLLESILVALGLATKKPE